MGNYISCSLSNPTASGNLRSAAKVILPTGEVQQFLTPTNAAELMLETPDHFLVNSMSLRRGCRFSALNADEELEMGNVYVMFPMKRLNSTITTSDMGRLFLKATSGSRKAATSSSSHHHHNNGLGAGRVRVSPEYDEVFMQKRDGTSPEVPRLSLEGIEEVSTPEFRHMMSMSRSKKPLLETIAEEGPGSVRSR